MNKSLFDLYSLIRSSVILQHMQTVKKYQGTIFSGIGVAQTRVADNIDLYEKKTGMHFFPGTLNVRVTRNEEWIELNTSGPAFL